MDYISHIPAPPLNAYIDDLYYLDGQSLYPRLKISPDAMLHLMVNLGPPFEVYAPNQATPFATCSESWWIGLWSQYWINVSATPNPQLPPPAPQAHYALGVATKSISSRT